MKKLALGLLLASSAVHADLSFVALTDTKFKIDRTQSVQAQYEVTNHFEKGYTLVMYPILGVKQLPIKGSCTTSGQIQPNSSCTLLLEIRGDRLEGSIRNAPTVCADGIKNLCFQPKSFDRLEVELIN